MAEENVPLDEVAPEESPVASSFVVDGSRIVYNESQFTNVEGLRIFTQSWVPPNPKALVVLFHGLAEHSTRYVPLARYLAEQGYAVHAHDHQGHGMSDGEKEYVDHFDDVLEDAYKAATVAKQNYPEIPHIALGHDMGALLVATIIKKTPKTFDGVILSGLPTRLPPDVGNAGHTVSKFASWLFPWLRPRTRDFTVLSRDPDVLKSYNSDPLNWHDDIPLQLETSINSAGLEVYENAESLEVPFLLLQGTADKIVDSWGPREIHLRARSTDKTYIEFKGFYHELLNEPEKMEIYKMIDRWLEERILDGAWKKIDANMVIIAESDGANKLKVTADS